MTQTMCKESLALSVYKIVRLERLARIATRVSPQMSSLDVIHSMYSFPFITASFISIDQNRPMLTWALSFSLGMQPNNDAYYTSFAIAHMNTFCLNMKCSQTLGDFPWASNPAYRLFPSQDGKLSVCRFPNRTSLHPNKCCSKTSEHRLSQHHHPIRFQCFTTHRNFRTSSISRRGILKATVRVGHHVDDRDNSL